MPFPRLLPFFVLAGAHAFGFSPIDLHGFHDSANHWRNFRDDSRVIKASPNQPAYTETQVAEVVANVLLFQRDNGGWPKDYDMAAILTDEQKAIIRDTHAHTDTSYDNGNIHSQVDYLARAIAQEDRSEWRASCLRGFDFLLASQLSSGGFPQRYPDAKGFHAYITFNDYVTIGILNVLKDAANGAPHWQWLDEGHRTKAREAVARGLACILRCQIRTGEQLTGWCQQHDPETFEARPGRAFELASICPQDTTEVVRFLLRHEQPTPETIASVNAAVAWLQAVPLKGMKVDKIAAPKEEFQRHTADYDKALVPDPAAPPLWARHYEIGSNRPVFAGRDGERKYAFAEIERERRTGTPWFGTWPQKLIDREYPAWQTRVAAGRKAP